MQLGHRSSFVEHGEIIGSEGCSHHITKAVAVEVRRGKCGDFSVGRLKKIEVDGSTKESVSGAAENQPGAIEA